MADALHDQQQEPTTLIVNEDGETVNLTTTMLGLTDEAATDEEAFHDGRQVPTVLLVDTNGKRIRLTTAMVGNIGAGAVAAHNEDENAHSTLFGAKADLVDGMVPSGQLPSYVDDVIELLAITATAPETCATGDKYFDTDTNLIYTATATNTWGETGVAAEQGKIYVDLSSNFSYRWTGSAIVEITNALDYATQEEAEAGTENTKVMTALRVKEAIDANLPAQTTSTPQVVTITDGAGAIVARSAGYHFINFTAAIVATTALTTDMSDGDILCLQLEFSGTYTVTLTGVTEPNSATVVAVSGVSGDKIQVVINKIGTIMTGRV